MWDDRSALSFCNVIGPTLVSSALCASFCALSLISTKTLEVRRGILFQLRGGFQNRYASRELRFPSLVCSTSAQGIITFYLGHELPEQGSVKGFDEGLLALFHQQSRTAYYSSRKRGLFFFFFCTHSTFRFIA